MKKTYSILEFVNAYKLESVKEMLKTQKEKFVETFAQNPSSQIEIEICFEDNFEMNEFYNELKYNKRYSSLYTIRSHQYKNKCLVVSGKSSLFDYLGSNEPNLLTLSRNLDINFKVHYIQKYSSTEFKGEVICGELLSRHCLVEVSEVLPELSLGLLNQIGSNQEELDLLLTRIVTIPPTPIL